MTADFRAGWTSRIQTSSGTTLAGAPVIALHGFTGRGSDWAALREHLRGHAWLTPDLPGHGPAPVLPADFAAHRAIVGRALGFFTEAPVLIGYSMGARVALHLAMARRRDFSALILIGGSPGSADPDERAARRAADAALASRIRETTTERFLAEWDALPLLAGKSRVPEPHRSRSLAARLQNTPEGLAASLEGCGTGALPPLWDAISDLDLPTLLVTGAEDMKFDAIAADMVRAAPQFDRTVIPGAGHAPQLERPAATASALETWLALQNGTDR